MTDISVVVPLYNEEENFPELTNRLFSTLEKLGLSYEVIFVDDGSHDSTAELIVSYAEKNKNTKALIFSRNFGHQSAVTAGIEHSTGNAVVIIDGDLQDPPEFIKNLYKKHLEGFDVVYAVRQKRKESFWKRMSYLVFYRVINRLVSDVHLPTDSGDFSLISQNIVKVMRSMPEHNRYVRGLRSWAGFKQTGLVYERDARFAGESKYSFFKLAKLGYDGIFSFSYVPITFVKMVGFLFSVVSFFGILIVLYFRLFTAHQIPGFASLAIMILFLGGVQLFSLGVLGEYIRRIYDEAKSRPLFVINRKIGL